MFPFDDPRALPTPYVWQDEKSDTLYFIDTVGYDPCLYEIEGPIEKVYTIKSQYQTVQIFNTIRFGRALAIDGTIQCAEKDEARYHEAFVHPAMILHMKPKNILICGGGDGATLREVLKHPSVEKATLVDIDEEVIKVTQERMTFLWAESHHDPRAHVSAGDAFAFLKSTDERFDVIFSDITDPTDEVSLPLYSKNYFNLIRARLAPGGIVVAQGAEISEVWQNPGRLLIWKLINSVFKTHRTAAYQTYVPSFREERSFCIATTDPPSWFDASHLPPWALQKFDYLEGSFRFYSPEMHKALFALPPVVEKIYERALRSR
ncbi:MAG: hypothetical protein Q7R73_00650 [bacterium]|nr:hypothetical protein [bacterium]